MLWNSGGCVSVALPIIQTLCDTNEVLSLKEHLLAAESLSFFSAIASTVVKICAARHSGASPPSGGTAILAGSILVPEHFWDFDYFKAVKIPNCVVVSGYVPSDYRNAISERQFCQACHLVSALVSVCEVRNQAVILACDMNSNLSDDGSSRENIPNSMCPQLLAVKNTQGSTYIHIAGSTPSPEYETRVQKIIRNGMKSPNRLV